MDTKVSELTINGIIYVPKGSYIPMAESTDGLKYCIVRTQSAGVFAGYIKSRTGSEVKMINARRLWYWVGAATLSQLGVDGVAKPNECKFPCEVPVLTILNAIEIIECTVKAQASIASVPEWKV